MPRYLLHFLIATLTWAAALLGLNWLADPYGIFHPDPQRAPALLSERIFKTVYLARQPADTLLLGTSRVDLGFKAEQLPNAHSLATFGQTFHESYRLLQHTLSYQTPKHVLIGVDFFAFNGLFPMPSDYTEANFDPARPLHLAFSISTASDAWRALRQKPGQSDGCCYASGFRDIPQPSGIQYQTAFRNNERAYLMEKYSPFPACRYTYDYSQPKNGMRSTLEELRAVLELARQRRIALTLFIPPAHARQWETLAAAGLWTQWEDWKRQLVQLNQASGNVATLWDFSGYSQISREALPPADSTAAMTGYTDSAHFTPAVGAQLLARLQGAPAPVDFGVALTADNLDSHLAAIRQARTRYQVEHPADVAAIHDLAREVAQTRRCPK